MESEKKTLRSEERTTLGSEEKTAVANPQSFMYTMVMFGMTCIFILPFEIDRENTRQEFLSKAHLGGFFMIMTIASASVAVLASVCLFFASFFLRRWMKNIHYTVLKTVGCFSAILAPFSLQVVLYLPHNLNWIVYSLVYVIFFVGILAGYYFAWKYVCCYQLDQQFNRYPFHWTMFLFILVPLMYGLTPFLPPSAQLPFICVCLLVLVAGPINTYITDHGLTQEKLTMQLGTSSSYRSDKAKTIRHP